MIGAIIGDIVGSRFEAHNHKSKDFELFTPDCSFTDDSAMTLAVANALLDCNGNYEPDILCPLAIKNMQQIGRKYPNCGYGQRFWIWLHSNRPRPYNSYGNGAAMRISPVAYVAKTIRECVDISEMITSVSHNHQEGLKGAEVTALATWMALHGHSKNDILLMVEENEYYTLDFTIDDLRDYYQFDASCQETVPVAIQAFFESTDFEDAIRLAISVGGDSDTIAAITGGIAGAYYDVPNDIREKTIQYLPKDLIDILMGFESRFQSQPIGCHESKE